MKKNNIKRFILLIIMFILLYQDSLTELLKINLLNYIDEFFILFLFFMAIIKSRGKIPKFVLNLWGLMIIFLLIGICSCLIYSNYNSSILFKAPMLMVKFFILIGSIILINPSQELKKNIIYNLKILGKISLIAGVINFCLPSIWTKIVPYTYIYMRMGLNSSMGLFIHAGQYGWFMFFVAILYLSEYYYYKDKKDYRKFIIYSICALLSLKVKVIISIIVIILAYEYIINKKKVNIRKIIIPFICIFLIFTYLGDLIFDAYNQYFTQNNGDTSARYALLNNSINIARDYFPLGVGFGKYGSYYATKYYSEYYFKYGLNNIYGLEFNNIFFGMDTFWPAIIGETGVLGTIIYILMLLYIWSNLKKSSIKSKFNNSNNKCMNIMGILVFLQTIVESSGEPIFNSSPQNIFIAVIIAIALLNLKSSEVNKNDMH